MDRGRDLLGIAVAGDVHVEGRRIGAQQMVVHGGDIEAGLDELGHHGIDLGFQKHDVAHRHHAAMGRLERDPAAERQPRLDGNAVERHLQVAAREAVAMDVAADRRRLAAERGVDLAPVDVLCGRGAREPGEHDRGR